MNQKIWNHNFAYNKWIKNKVKNKKNILDVGCGNGYLMEGLQNKNRKIVGIDIDISECYNPNIINNNISYVCGDFLQFDFKEQKFDAIIFVASIHHMDYEKAITKAKKLLTKDGIIIIVGLSKPSSPLDILVEILRVIPCSIISKLKHMQTSEDLNINVSYVFPELNDIRKISKRILPGYKLRYGLYYRYLLTWENK